ncbi:MAG: hypothetical protein K5839_05320 [Treponemataceae bacterium]|nr:hypothetical protein [Treponemataceae bacterium]
MKNNTFSTDEIIFAATDSCNLKCAHCFVERKGLKLDCEKATHFIENCLNSSPEIEWKVGFTGGEPFLNLDFLCSVSKFCVEKGIIFDRIMTNALWWKNEKELAEKLTRLYESGYDGKIGISFDTFHGGDFRYTAKFCRKVFEIWKNPSMIEIQATYAGKENFLHTMQKQKTVLKLLALELGGKIKFKKNSGIIENSDFMISFYLNHQSLQSENSSCWKDKKWFKDDFCAGPGHIFFVHPDGNIAPCCGYANENPELFIGTIDDDYQTLMKKAESSRMIKLCYEEGLENFRKKLEKDGRKFPGKTNDICMFCDYVCKNEAKSE